MGFRDWISENIIDIGAAQPGAPGGGNAGAAGGGTAPGRASPAPARPVAPGEVPVHPTGKTVAQIAREVPRPRIDPEALASGEKPSMSFDQVYRAAGVPSPPHGFDIFKVEQLLASERLKTLSPEAKSAAVLVALDAQGVKIEDVIKDAVTRDKALDAFEQFQLKKLIELQGRVESEAKRLQGEIEQFIRQRHQAIEANQKKLKSYEQEISAWRRQKGLEEQRLYSVVAHFTSSNPITMARTVTSLEPAEETPEAGPAAPVSAAGLSGAAGGSGGASAGPQPPPAAKTRERDPLEAACEGLPPVTDLSDFGDDPGATPTDPASGPARI